jgi:hypothetical protein
MNVNWRSFCSAKNLTVDGEFIRVSFHEGRQHTVHVQEEADCFYFKAVVARSALVATLDAAVVMTWVRNRTVSLIGFRIDQRGRLLGEARVPKVGITREEFCLYVNTVAGQSDRFEQQIVGVDQE